MQKVIKIKIGATAVRLHIRTSEKQKIYNYYNADFRVQKQKAPNAGGRNQFYPAAFSRNVTIHYIYVYLR